MGDFTHVSLVNATNSKCSNAPNCFECPPYNGGAFLLDGNTVVGSLDFGKYIISG